MKKSTYWIVAVIILVIGAYLYLSHAYIYHFIKVSGLGPSDRQHSYTMGNNLSTKKIIYASLGDSLTAGVGVDKYEESYPYLLAEKFAGSDKEITLKNFGIPGARTEDLINYQLAQAIAEKPDIITILIGTNDIHGNVGETKFKKNYQYILDKLTKETKAKIYTINIPYIGSNTLILPPYNFYFDHEITKYNKIIQYLAENYNVKYIDLATPTSAMLKKNGPYYAADKFHPSAEGYKLWSQIIYDDINK